jgi:hypothetical protein
MFFVTSQFYFTLSRVDNSIFSFQSNKVWRTVNSESIVILLFFNEKNQFLDLTCAPHFSLCSFFGSEVR